MRQRRLGRAAVAACAGAATMTMTMAVPAAAASGRADCPGIDVRDPLNSAKCPVDDVTRQVLPSKPATSVPTKSPTAVRTSAPATKESYGDRPTRPARRTAATPAAESARGGVGKGGSATWFVPPLPATMRWSQAGPSYPYVEPSYPYPEVAGEPAYDGRATVRAASAEGTEDARSLWTRIATALVLLLCALHLGVASRRLRQEASHPLS